MNAFRTGSTTEHISHLTYWLIYGAQLRVELKDSHYTITRSTVAMHIMLSNDSYGSFKVLDYRF